MPQPQIPHHHTPFPHHWLTRRPYRPPLFQQTRPYPPARPLAVRALLHLQRSEGVRAQPHFRRPVRGRHGHERHVDHEREWRERVREVGVCVRGLRAGWAGGGGWEGGVGADEGEVRDGAKGCGGYLGYDGVCGGLSASFVCCLGWGCRAGVVAALYNEKRERMEQEYRTREHAPIPPPRYERRILLDVAPVVVVWAVLARLQHQRVPHHLRVQCVERGVGDQVFEDDQAVAVKGPRCDLEVPWRQLAGLQLGGANGDTEGG